MQRILSILGSTGSIGTQTLEVVREHPSLFKIAGLAAGKNIKQLKPQLLEFQPEVVSVFSKTDVHTLEAFINKHHLHTTVVYGPEGLNHVATLSTNQLIVVAIVGTDALLPTFNAISNGISIALASKEILVVAGAIIMKKAAEMKVPIIPIDSEHVAIKQCLSRVDEDITCVQKLILTASGGPFCHMSRDDMKNVSIDQALAHPNWDMGPKITIDSATMMNKGLEIIEARFLFDIDIDFIDVVIHPQSIIHSMVEFRDGHILAQMGPSDMRYSIQYALSYPTLLKNSWPNLDVFSLSSLTFLKPDYHQFPLLKLAYEVGRQGGSSPVVFNAANEVAVQLFLKGKIGFLDISEFVEKALTLIDQRQHDHLSDIIALDCYVKEKLAYEFA